jgi:hypothetical protein
MYQDVYMLLINNLDKKTDFQEVRYNFECIYTIRQCFLCDRSPLAAHMFNISRAFQH